MKVDKFIPVIPLPDDTICELAEARFFVHSRKGLVDVEDPAIPEAAEVLYTEREIVILSGLRSLCAKKRYRIGVSLPEQGIVSPGYDEYAGYGPYLM